MRTSIYNAMAIDGVKQEWQVRDVR